jgi:hypothetical protein
MGRRSHHHGHHGHGDHYVTGHTNWDSYELPQLIAMVNEKVDIPALVRLADDWRYAGDDLMESARDLGDALDQLMDFWSGDAAEQARTDVALNAQWVADLGETARAVGDPVEEAAGALKAAQDQMPDLPAAQPAPGSAPVGATNGEAAGGPLGAAIGGVAAGSESAAQASEQQAKLKLQAVETMRRFETAAMSIDAAIPEFIGPDTELHPDPKEKHPVARPVQPPATTIVVDTNTTLSWQRLTGAGTSAADFAAHGAGATHGGPAAGGGFSAGGGHAGGGAGGVGGVAPGPRPVRGPGVGSVSGATPPPIERVGPGPGTLPAAAALPVELEGHGAGMAGAPMGAGMGAGAGAGTGNDHRRRFPFEEEDPFSPNQKASPPVIGL